MIDHGVWIATGESFKSEMPGWFRITFAVPEEEFMFGVDRYVFTLLLSDFDSESVRRRERREVTGES